MEAVVETPCLAVSTIAPPTLLPPTQHTAKAESQGMSDLEKETSVGALQRSAEVVGLDGDPFFAEENHDGALSEVERETLPTMPDADLHKEIVAACNGYKKRCGAAHWYAYERLIPFCEEVRKRYAMPGRAAKYRLNNQPRVKDYFASIGLNYDTVRNWISDFKHRQHSSPRYENLNLPMVCGSAKDSTRDLKKIERLIKKIKSIADVHDLDVSTPLEALLKIASAQLGGPEWPDPALTQAAVLGPPPTAFIPRRPPLSLFTPEQFWRCEVEKMPFPLWDKFAIRNGHMYTRGRLIRKMPPSPAKQERAI